MYYAVKLTRLHSVKPHVRDPAVQYTTLQGDSLDSLTILHSLQNIPQHSGELLGRRIAGEQISLFSQRRGGDQTNRENNNQRIDYATVNYEIPDMSLLDVGRVSLNYSKAYHIERLNTDERRWFEEAMYNSWKGIIESSLQESGKAA